MGCVRTIRRVEHMQECALWCRAKVKMHFCNSFENNFGAKSVSLHVDGIKMAKKAKNISAV